MQSLLIPFFTSSSQPHLSPTPLYHPTSPQPKTHPQQNLSQPAAFSIAHNSRAREAFNIQSPPPLASRSPHRSHPAYSHYSPGERKFTSSISIPPAPRPERGRRKIGGGRVIQLRRPAAENERWRRRSPLPPPHGTPPRLRVSWALITRAGEGGGGGQRDIREGFSSRAR